MTAQHNRLHCNASTWLMDSGRQNESTKYKVYWNTFCLHAGLISSGHQVTGRWSSINQSVSTFSFTHAWRGVAPDDWAPPANYLRLRYAPSSVRWWRRGSMGLTSKSLRRRRDALIGVWFLKMFCNHRID